MDLQALGNIGEFVGAIGVVASLIYLAAQVRDAKKVAQAESLRQINATYQRIALLITGDGELAHIFRSGCQDITSLDPQERMRFSHLMGNLMLHFLECHTAHQAGLMDDEVYTRWEAYTAMVMNMPGAASDWDHLQHFFKDDVRAAINAARARLPDAASVHPGMFGSPTDLLTEVPLRGS